MSPAHKRFLLLEEGVGSVIVNLALNGLIAYLMFRGAAVVPLWGQQSIAGDNIGTTFLLPLITCLIVTPLARRQVRAGRVPPVVGASLGLQWMPERTFRRGARLGLITAIVIAPPTIATLAALGVTQQRFWEFVAFKAVFAAALGAVVTPLIALWAISENAPNTQPVPAPLRGG
jgi:hypothetical protein